MAVKRRDFPKRRGPAVSDVTPNTDWWVERTALNLVWLDALKEAKALLVCMGVRPAPGLKATLAGLDADQRHELDDWLDRLGRSAEMWS